MHFTPAIASSTAVPAFSLVAGLPDAGRVLGRVALRIADLEDGGTITARHEFIAGGRIGAFDGYETLRAAMADLASVTAGDVAAAAVIERGGRFFGHALKGRDVLNAGRRDTAPVYLEEDEGAKVLELRAFDRHRRLRAIVDGSYTHRFRG